MQLDHLRARLGAEKLKNGVPRPAEISKFARQLFAAPDLAPPRARRIRTPLVPMGHPGGAHIRDGVLWKPPWA